MSCNLLNDFPLPDVDDTFVLDLVRGGAFAGPLLSDELPEPPEDLPEFKVMGVDEAEPGADRTVRKRYVVGSVDVALGVEQLHRQAESWIHEHYAAIEAQLGLLVAHGIPLHRIEVRHDWSDPSCITTTVQWRRDGDRRRHVCTEVPSTESAGG